MILVTAARAGWVPFHSRPVIVLARDAETGQPIPGAEVRLSLLAGPSAPVSATAGKDGIARIPVAGSGNASYLLEVVARGYLLQEQDLPSQTVAAIKPVHPFESVDRRPPNVVVELYAEPRPRVELVVPSGYHGPVRVEVRVQAAASYPRGQRVFSCEVPPSGTVQLDGPPVLRHLFATDFTARLTDGTPLGPDAVGTALGCWWLRTEGTAQCFLVGTRSELGVDAPSGPSTGHNPAPGGGQGGGGGHRGRRGNTSAP